MSKIRTVDIKIKATGNGVVNWNGSIPLKGEDGKEINNHTLPKMVGYTNLNGKVKEDNGYLYKKTPYEMDFKKNPLYISSNCIKHFLYKEESYDLHFIDGKVNKIEQFIPTFSGLFRGYVVASTGYKRAASILFEDMIDQLGNGTYEQFVNSSDFDEKEGKKGSTSLFSKTTFGDTEYIGYASINIENLQFLSFDGKFDRKMANLNEEEIFNLCNDIEKFINSIDDSKNPEAVFHKEYVRSGSIFKTGEAGILLNQDALEILVKGMLEKIENLYIQQSQGWMCVEEIEVDYNNTSNYMRIKRDPSSISSTKEVEYKTYFEAKEEV